ncbi:MAG: PQQ-binding-like beta-propeller repeat protein [Spirochaetaceae bacterium]
MSSGRLNRVTDGRSVWFLTWTVLGVLALLWSCGAGAGEESREPAPVEAEEEPREEREARPGLYPEDPGKSGVLASPEDAERSAGFFVRRGAVSSLPVVLVARGEARAEVDRRGVLSFYEAPPEASDEARWEHRGVLPLLSLGAEFVTAAVEGGVVALGRQAGEELWRVAIEEVPADLRARREGVLVGAGRSVLWIDSERGEITDRQNLRGSAAELLLGPETVYVVTDTGVEAYGEDRELRWRFDAPRVRRGSLSSGEDPVLLLESGEGLLALSATEGELLWELPGERLAMRPVLLEDRFFLPRENGVLEARSWESGELLWSEGVVPGIAARPRFWLGSLWVPSLDGSLVSISSEGEDLGFLDRGAEVVALLYGDGERLGAIDQFGSFLELEAGGDDLRLSLREEEEGGAFDLPSLEPGGGPLLFALEREPVRLSVEQAGSGIYLFRLPLQGETETIIDLLDEEGTVLGSNLDKIELAETVRIRLERGESYRIEARPARDDLAGALAAVSLQLLREER